NVNVVISGGEHPESAYVSGTRYLSDGITSAGTFLLENGVASGFVVNQNGWQDVVDGGIANGTQVIFGNQWISGGSAYGTIITAGQQEVYGMGGLADGTVLHADPENEDNWAHQDIGNGGLATNTTVNAHTEQNIHNGGTAYDTVINSKGKQHINFGGVANDAVLNDEGEQHINRGGTANGTTVNNGNININNGGVANDIVLNGGWVNVDSGGTANNTTLNSGDMGINGTADGITINADAWINVNNGGVANNVIISSGAWQGVHAGGNADTVEVNSGGTLEIDAGGTATDIVQSNGGNINAVITGGDTGITIAGTNQNGEEFKAEDGTATGFILNAGGWQDIVAGASAEGTLVLGGVQYIEDATANDTELTLGGRQIIVGGSGIANGTVINGGSQEIADGGTAANAEVNGGAQYIGNGGNAENTTVNSGAWQHINGGTAANAQINAGAMQAVSHGAANNTTVAGGRQMLYKGGSADGTTVNSGFQIIDGGESDNAAITATGTQLILAGNADGTNLSDGGTQSIYDGATADNTVIDDGGTQLVQHGGYAGGTAVNDGGTQYVLAGGIAEGTSVNDGGLAEINGSAINAIINAGGIMRLCSGANADGIAVSGGMADIYGNMSFTGNAVLSENGIISFARTDNTPITLTAENISGEGGVFLMNVDLAEKTGDKIVINGTHEGNAQLRLSNAGSSASDLSGNDLTLVEYGENAAHNGTFSLFGGVWDVGAYEYALTQGTDYNYYLRSTGNASPAFKAMANMPSLNIITVQTAMNSLQKRLGDLREMKGSDYSFGTWARGYYKDTTVSDMADTDMKVSGTEAGFDWNISDGNNTMYLGIMGGYMNVSGIKSSQGEKTNSGSGNGFTGGMYLTVSNDRGWFMDITARGMETEYEMKQYASGLLDLNYKTKRTVFAGSIETGYSFMKDSRTGFRFEPKAEAQYVNAPRKDYDVKNGEGISKGTLSYAGADYLTGIGALQISYALQMSKDLKAEPFAEVSYSYEFMGEEEITYGGRTMKTKSRNGTFEGRAGINVQITPALYVHAAGSYEKGNMTKSWGADGGIRFMFGGKTKKSEENTAVAAAEPVKKSKTANAEVQAVAVSEQAAETLPTAVNPMPGTSITELNREQYLENAANAKSEGLKDGKQFVPSMGALFKTGQSVLLPYYAEMLDSFISLYKQTDMTAGILVEGYSSNGGNETRKNPELSMQRAKSVADYLISNGIPKENIEIKAYSNTAIAKRVFSKDKGCNGGQCYRRVNISIK
ncbi:MAG: autotransporter outer membrane beta-barrel domain-containing protein, partial [Elusimicrobiales bacterium]|nr:autotransporter outer membrane beta-barrel domain-containing protein [Elusimicrobiales bacterium]